jgi:signal transduction histidine kinase
MFIINKKLLIVLLALLIGLYSIHVSQQFMNTVSESERKQVELWAEAIKVISQSDGEPGTDYVFIHNVVESNTSVPCILINEIGEILSFKNVSEESISTPEKLEKELKKMRDQNNPIEIDIPGEETLYMYYDDSNVQKILKKFPFYQILAITLLIGLIYYVITTSNKSEQNKVWIGMAKETAHQLGTPISGLLGWVEILKVEKPNIAEEIEKEVIRLEKISNRFSKIGTKENKNSIVDIQDIIEGCIDYASRRASKNIRIVEANRVSDKIYAKMSKILWEWVIENLIRNSVDAVGEQGIIEVETQIIERKICVDVKDNGKGIAPINHKKIFRPGYTTKNRGWGLGLSLCKRIIEDYYHGKIFVLSSDIGKGTTIRIQLKQFSL